MSGISTHVLDTATGRPASGVAVTLERRVSSGAWTVLAKARTDADGRVRDLAPRRKPLPPGLYSLRFDTSSRSKFFPEVVLRFRITRGGGHLHLPLLLSPFGYTIYRGS